MKSLGKILFIMMVLESFVIASVHASLEHNPILEGDEAVLIIEASGKDIVFPNLEEIAGVKITGKSTTRSIISTNGKIKKTLIRRYTFHPIKPLDIPVLSVRVDGKEEMTTPLKLAIKKDEKDGKKAFVFSQLVDKNKVYIGEPIVLSYLFKQRKDIDLSDANFNAPAFKNFWAKRTAQVPNTTEGDYNIYRINYILYPQKEGDLRLESARMDVGIQVTRKKDFFNFQNVKWKSIYSNDVSIQVKPLPSGVTLFGDYSFTVVADKNVTKVNEPVNLTITIRGEGNVDDIDDFEVTVPNATVYADKAKRNSALINGKNEVIFKQKFAVVSDRNFTIPPLSFRFFNGAVKELHSRAFQIEVKNPRVIKRETHLEKKEPIEKERRIKEVVVEKTSRTLLGITAFFSFLLGALSMWLLRYKRAVKVEESPIRQRIKNSKSDKELLALLLPYVDKTPQMQKLITQLEENIYHDKKHRIDKRALSKEFESYLIEQKTEEILKG
jgi:hypothetical protein